MGGSLASDDGKPNRRETMAKNKANKANETTTMIVRKKDVGAVRGLLNQLIEDDKPAKPLKPSARKLKFTKAQLKALTNQIKNLAPQLRELEKESDRLQALLDTDRLSPADEKWLEKESKDVYSVLELAQEKLSVFY